MKKVSKREGVKKKSITHFIYQFSPFYLIMVPTDTETISFSVASLSARNFSSLFSSLFYLFLFVLEGAYFSLIVKTLTKFRDSQKKGKKVFFFQFVSLLRNKKSMIIQTLIIQSHSHAPNHLSKKSEKFKGLRTHLYLNHLRPWLIKLLNPLFA